VRVVLRVTVCAVKIVVTARRRLPRVTIVSSRETREVEAVVALLALVAVTEATTVVLTEDRTEAHLGLTGGATDCQTNKCTVLSSDRLCGCTDVNHL